MNDFRNSIPYPAIPSLLESAGVTQAEVMKSIYYRDKTTEPAETRDVLLLVKTKDEQIQVLNAGIPAIEISSDFTPSQFSEEWNGLNNFSFGTVICTLDKDQTKEMQTIIENVKRTGTRWIGYKKIEFESLKAIHKSVLKALNVQDLTAADVPQFNIISGEDAKAEPSEYLWYPYIPKNQYTAIYADGGTGKTTLLCGICAMVTSGKPFPNEHAFTDRKPERILYISGEETAGELKEKIEVSGGDPKLCSFIGKDEFYTESGEGFKLEYLYDVIERSGAGLVIVDPFHQCLNGADINKIEEVGSVLRKVSYVAKLYNIAIILVTHPNKGRNDKNINNSALGSGAFITIARSALTVVRESRDDTDPMRLMFQTKANAMQLGQTIRFEIFAKDEHHVPGMKWAGISLLTKSDLEFADRYRMTLEEIIDEQERIARPIARYIESISEPNATILKTWEDFAREMKAQNVEVGSRPAGYLKKALPYIAGREFYTFSYNKWITIEEAGKKTQKRGFSVSYHPPVQIELQ